MRRSRKAGSEKDLQNTLNETIKQERFIRALLVSDKEFFVEMLNCRQEFLFK